jgi:hypothetical protein
MPKRWSIVLRLERVNEQGKVTKVIDRVVDRSRHYRDDEEQTVRDKRDRIRDKAKKEK